MSTDSGLIRHKEVTRSKRVEDPPPNDWSSAMSEREVGLMGSMFEFFKKRAINKMQRVG